MGPGRNPGKRGVDRLQDQVVRLQDFRARNPRVLITSPKQNGTLRWEASWAPPGADPGDKSALREVRHPDLRLLLDDLEQRFGGGA